MTEIIIAGVVRFYGPITYKQHEAAELYCQLHDPPYCLLIWYVPGHPFHRHPCKLCEWI